MVTPEIFSKILALTISGFSKLLVWTWENKLSSLIFPLSLLGDNNTPLFCATRLSSWIFINPFQHKRVVEYKPHHKYFFEIANWRFAGIFTARYGSDSGAAPSQFPAWGEFYVTLVSKDSSCLLSAQNQVCRLISCGWRAVEAPREAQMTLSGTDGTTCCCCPAARGAFSLQRERCGLCCTSVLFRVNREILPLLFCTLQSCSSCCLYLTRFCTPLTQTWVCKWRSNKASRIVHVILSCGVGLAELESRWKLRSVQAFNALIKH